MVIWTLKEYLKKQKTKHVLTYRPQPPSGSWTERRYLTISFFQASGREILATWQVIRRPVEAPKQRHEIPHTLFYLYSINSQQQPPQAVLYFKLKTLIQRKHQQSKQRTNSIWTGNLQNQSQGGTVICVNEEGDGQKTNYGTESQR